MNRLIFGVECVGLWGAATSGRGSEEALRQDAVGFGRWRVDDTASETGGVADRG